MQCKNQMWIWRILPRIQCFVVTYEGIFKAFTELATTHFFHNIFGNKAIPADIKGNTKVGEKATAGFLWNLSGQRALISSNTAGNPTAFTGYEWNTAAQKVQLIKDLKQTADWVILYCAVHANGLAKHANRVSVGKLCATPTHQFGWLSICTGSLKVCIINKN